MAKTFEISVAPMEGVTTFPMRVWLHMVSQPRFMTSPFLRVTRAFPETELPDTFIPELLQLRGALPYQLIPQFITGDPEQFLRAAEFIPPAVSEVIEINCGCPSPNSLGRYAGSGMLREPEYFARSIENLSRELGPGRLAVKMRLGVESDAEFPELVKALAALPLARLTVHARTRADGYRGRARWSVVQHAATQTRTPVHASGDVLGIESWNQLLAIAPGIQGAMIGRGLLRNPWVFREMREGTPTSMDTLSFINALFAFLLIHDLSIRHPEKLLQRVARDRLGHVCGTDFGAWEKTIVELTSLCFGIPFLLLQGTSLHGRTVSPVAFSRLRLLWSYLRSGLPENFAPSSLMKARQPQDFFEQLFLAAEGISSLTIGHQAAWDEQFAGARG